jgi:hypothetical protein
MSLPNVIRYLKSEVILILMIFYEWNLNLGNSERMFEGLLGQGNAISSPKKVPKKRVARCLLYSMELMAYIS